MDSIRLIARLDIKNNHVIKGIHLEGLRKVGDPNELARKYYEAGIDEVLFIDAVASLYERNNIFPIIEKACREVFIPITVGGGIRTIKDIEDALKAGADKIAINTQAVKTPDFITKASRIYGSQCIVGSIEAKQRNNKWEVYTDNGREESGIDVIEWACRLEDFGAGELLVTSVDQEGTKKGFDLDLLREIEQRVSIPVIASGGAGNSRHISEMVRNTNVGAVAVASVLHYGLESVSSIKLQMSDDKIKVRL